VDGDTTTWFRVDWLSELRPLSSLVGPINFPIFGEGGRAMTEPVVYISTWKIKEGKFDAYARFHEPSGTSSRGSRHFWRSPTTTAPR